MNVEPSSFFCADTQEKVNLSRRRYGMPANITISAKGNAGCAPVIMIQTSDLDRMDPDGQPSSADNVGSR